MSVWGEEGGLQPIRVVIISGLSGSGKSTAIHALEDIGFFCIDNLPVVLLPKLVELFPRSPGEIEKIALVVDAREARFLDGFEENVERIRAGGSRVELLFLDCSDAMLMRRYSETRRRHPLAADETVEQGIARERALLATLRKAADRVIDTSEMNLHQLRELIQQYCTRAKPGGEMNVNLLSFGFKYGIPSQADLVFDVRFLPNPYFVPHLRHLTGLDPAVRGFAIQNPEAEQLLRYITEYLKTFRPLYDREGKSYLTVGIGCTGGRHRSVAIAEELGLRLAGSGTLLVNHRDLDNG
jgi:UPF0042 nucleotide-binding protein